MNGLRCFLFTLILWSNVLFAIPDDCEQNFVFTVGEVVSAKGLDENLIELHFNERTRPTQFVAFVTLFYNRQVVGHGFAERLERSEQWQVTSTMVDSDFQRKGLGTLIYLSLARYIADRFGGELTSKDHSPDARAVWERFAKVGIANKADASDGNPVFTMNLEKLRTATQAIDRRFVGPAIEKRRLSENPPAR